MKTKILTFLIFSLIGLLADRASAQFLGDFFSQQAQKKKLMTEQIAAYQLYLGAIKTGYSIAEKGWTTAHGLKNGTFRLHSDYFSSLQQVAPAIKNNPKGRAIDSLYRQICSLFANEKQWQQQQKLLDATETGYLGKVENSLLAKAKLDLEELAQVLTPGRLQLTDAERLARLDKLYEAMKDKYAFAGYFTAKCRKLALQRQRPQKDRAQIKKLYGIQ
ncbi:hypothetical protein ACFFGT_10605 [Mucilaginibacter angelicae]|uniref:DUF3826 domain-containing protein n=1 Tax=Mucilaginibacter angelicae TaxID=869718 RepID=A0ABV6L5E9_9SPHI